MASLILQLIVAVAIAILLQPKIPGTPGAQPQELSPDDVNSIKLGQSLDVMWGTRLMGNSNVAWYGDFRSTPIWSD